MGLISSVYLLSFLSLFQTSVWGSPCVVFDTYFNLYALGIQGTHSWKIGQLNGLEAGTAANITTISSENRPKFDGSNTQCYLAQYFNAIYVVNGDAANPNNIHVYDATQDKWSVQKTDVSAGVNPNKITAILDHDTNVFFGLSDGVLYFLKMADTRVAGDDTIKWNVAGRPNFNTDGYQPLMGIAKNHIHFLNVPGSSPGQANIFVIHFAYFQPEVQAYQPREGQGTFPATTGKVTSIFAPSSTDKEQQYFAFIPDNGLQTFVVDVHSNTTSTLPPPAVADARSYYAGSDSALVQLTPQGQLYFLPFDYAQMTTAAAKWIAITSPQFSVLSSSLIATTPTAKSLAKPSTPVKASATSSSQRSHTAPYTTYIATFFASCILVLGTTLS